LDELTINLMN